MQGAFSTAILLGALTVAGIVAPARAQSPLDEADVARLALLRPDIQTLDAARLDAAAARRQAATALPDPTVEIAREAIRDFERVGAEDSVRLSVPLDLTGAWLADRAAARSTFKGERAAVEAQRAERYAEARRLYHRLAAQTRIAQAAAERADRLDEAARQADARRAAGDASELEAARFRAEASNARADVARLEVERASYEFELRALVGAPAATFALSSIAASEPPALDELLAGADSSPRARVLSEVAAAADLAARAAGRRAVAPSVRLTGGLRTIDDGMDRETGLVAGLSVALPLFGRDRAQAAIAQAEAIGARAEARLAQERTQAQVRALWVKAVQLQAAAVRSGDGSAERRLLRTASQAAFEGGEIDVAAWLDAERAAYESDVASAELMLEAALARIALDEIVGRTEIRP